MFNDQNAADMSGQLAAAELVYRGARFHYALMLNDPFSRGWCLYELLVRILAGMAALGLARAAELVPIAGVFVRADQLLDPSAPLLARVFRSDPVFPTGEFGSDAWRPILRVLGLQSAVTGDLFLQCARRVQRSFAQAVAEGAISRRHPCACPSLCA